MIPDMIHTPYIAPRISVMAPPPVTSCSGMTVIRRL